MHLCKLTMCVDRLVYILLYNYNNYYNYGYWPDPLQNNYVVLTTLQIPQAGILSHTCYH